MKPERLGYLLFFLASACASAPQGDGELDEVVAWMSGSFSSGAQAAADPEFRDVRLHMTPIWTAREDGRWLYVEQALAEAPARPYRQRVYHVHLDEHGLVSDVYELPGDPLVYAGTWRDPAQLATLAPERLTPRTGCSIRLERRQDGVFVGRTEHGACPSELQGAQYATSEVVIAPTFVESWDRGFDSSGRQMWGAKKGAYRFERSKDLGMH